MDAGIGVATGSVFAGHIGSVVRMEYTVMGETVNTASRLQELTKKTGFDIIIDETTRERLGELADVKHLPLRTLRGKSSSMRTFYLKGVGAE